MPDKTYTKRANKYRSSRNLKQMWVYGSDRDKLRQLYPGMTYHDAFQVALTDIERGRG